MLRLFRNRRFLKGFSAYVILHLLTDWISPQMVHALTSGPSTPEFSSFEPVGTSELVNVSTGDFVYNIPLMDVEGYPINLAYHSGVGMDQEASMVGLGWSLNLGAINRNVRGIPDDFKGDEIRHEFSMKPNSTVGLNLSPGLEFVGLDLVNRIKPSFGITYNNYQGYGTSISVGYTSDPSGNGPLGDLGYGLSLSYSSGNGVGINPSLSYSRTKEKTEGKVTNSTRNTLSVSGGFNSRMGLQTMGLGYSSRSSWQFELFGIDFDIDGAGSYGSGSISFSTPSYSPLPSTPYLMDSRAFYFTLGVEGFFSDLHGGIGGHTSTQVWLDKKRERAAFGYMYADQRSDHSELADFNREKIGAYIPGASRNLPLAQQTYDTYSVTGQGLTGQFRPRRNDIGIVSDPFVANLSANTSISTQPAVGNLGDLGGNIVNVVSTSASGKWTPFFGNRLADEVDFVDRSTINDPLYEPVYFKRVGEGTPVINQGFNESIGGENAVRPELSRSIGLLPPNIKPKTSSQLVDRAGTLYTPEQRKETRDIRNTLFSALTAAEAASFGHTQKLNYYYSQYSLSDYFTNGQKNYSTLSNVERNYGNRKDHHVSEITVTRPDGARYVYGLPAYNWKLIESSFNVSDNSQICESGLVAFDPGTDNSTDNDLGLDNFYSSTETPAYPYAHLLTSVLSSDYVDNDNIEGPSDGDIGSWHKVNYWRTAGSSDWRTPLAEDYVEGGDSYAGLNRGFLSDTRDDKGSYTYGEKEIYFVHSIESQHFLAVFEYDEREDNFPVQGEYGGIAAVQPNKKLVGVKLFAKEELKRESMGLGTAEPIKSVHFGYDYLLSPNTPNADNQSGIQGIDGNRKLTLTELSFSYGASNEARLSPYKFYYSDVLHKKPADVSEYDASSVAVYNPEYHSKAYDRWGNYSPACTSFDQSCTCDAGLANDEFPYVNQGFIPDTDPLYVEAGDRYADAYARVWNLHTITTPSGSQINIDYEADDYAYVQDKEALQMCKIEGFGAANSPTDFLYGAGASGDLINHDNLIISLPDNFVFPNWATTFQDRNDYFKEVMLEGLGEWLYLSVYTNLNRRESTPNNSLYPPRFEYVPCWVEWDFANSGLINNSATPTRARINLVPQGHKDDGSGQLQIQAVAKNAINYLRLNRPQYVTNPGAEPSATQLADKAFLKGFLGFSNELVTLFKGYVRTMYHRNYCREIEPERSWVRLGVPDKMKHGGGVRVSQITLSDQWEEMAGSPQESHTYGQKFEYTQEETLSNGEVRQISSGVAAYEPILGGDENPFRKPRFVTKSFLAANDERHFILEPMGESFFPGPQVIYSQVSVSSLSHQDITKHGTGKIVHEFYTAQDYPTIVRETDLKDYDEIPNPIAALTNFLHVEGSTVSQGYVIRRNNMHGQSKAQWVYGEGQEEPLSGMEYFYRTKGGSGYREGRRNELFNGQVPVLGIDGRQTQTTIGQEIDLIFDSQGIQSQTIGGDVRANVNASFTPFGIPLPLPSVYLIPQESRSYFRSMVATKVVDTYGIVEKVVAHDLGASVITENHLWDGSTGSVLITKSHNEYQDDRFQVTYPAHWVYDGMAQSYRNHKATFGKINLTLLTTGEAEIFVPGDQVYWRNDNFETSGIGWVLDVTSNSVSMIDENGSIFDADPGSGTSSDVDELIIFRSGRRNLSMTPVAGMVSEQLPIEETSPGSGEFVLAPEEAHNVLTTGATTLRQNLVSTPNQSGVIVNCEDYGFYESGSISDCLEESEIINPYYVGIRGTWIQDQAFSFLGERTSTGDLRNSGFLTDFSPFWLPPGSGIQDWSNDPSNWTFTQEPTLVSVHSGLLEAVDPLNIFSSVQYGYRRKLPVAQVANSKYSWMGFDGFEDYSLENECSYRHWPLWVIPGNGISGRSPEGFITESESHSGNKSLQLTGNQTLFSIQEFGDGNCNPGTNNINGEYELGSCDFQPYFSPEIPGPNNGPDQYILSFWVKSNENSNSTAPTEGDVENIVVGIVQCDSNDPEWFATLEDHSRSPVLDGWQRFEYLIDLNDDFSSTSLGSQWVLSIENDSQDKIFIDDIRVHPFNAVMNTYVYDSDNLRLLATGDANNFTRFYQYNPKGELVSVMVETENGVMSLEEARYNSAKNQ